MFKGLNIIEFSERLQWMMVSANKKGWSAINCPGLRTLTESLPGL
jgi:hypothetical protein